MSSARAGLDSRSSQKSARRGIIVRRTGQTIQRYTLTRENADESHGSNTSVGLSNDPRFRKRRSSLVHNGRRSDLDAILQLDIMVE